MKEFCPRTSGNVGIGPGVLIGVCGPSGAGKDTLLRRVQQMNAGRIGVIFPRRIVTRAASRFEAHERVTEEQFAQRRAAGEFAVWWSAHGLSYALPGSVDRHIRDGCCVVCNVSRAIIAQLRDRYARVVTVLVTAPPEILAARLAARGRVTDGNLADRLGRAAKLAHDLNPDVVIDNTGSIDDAANRLQDVIESQFITILF